MVIKKIGFIMFVILFYLFSFFIIFLTANEEWILLLKTLIYVSIGYLHAKFELIDLFKWKWKQICRKE